MRHWAAPYPLSTTAHPAYASLHRGPRLLSHVPLDTVQTQLCQILTVVSVRGVTTTHENQFQGSCIGVSVKEEKVAQKSLVWLRRSTFGCQCIAVSTLSWVRGCVGGRGGVCRFEDKRPDMQVCGTTCQLTPTRWSARIPSLMPHCFIPTYNCCLHIITGSICTHLKPIDCVPSVFECHIVY